MDLTAAKATLFMDTEIDTLAFTAESSNPAVASVPPGDISEANIKVMGIAAGPATITVKVTSDADGLWQTATMDFSVTVESSSS